jgi:hypothetical protein
MYKILIEGLIRTKINNLDKLKFKEIFKEVKMKLYKQKNLT